MRALVLHWGRTGGGPRFAADAVAALAANGIWTAYSSSLHSERLPSDRALGEVRLTVPTFNSAAGVVLRSPLSLAGGESVRAFVHRHRIDCVFAAMEQLWQPAAAWSLQRTGVPYLLGVHDGRFHLGEESTVRAVTRRLELTATDGVLAFSESARMTFAESTTFPPHRVWSTFLPARSAAGTMPPGPAIGRPLCFGFFGRLQPYKGVSLLLDAVRLLDQRAHEFEVEIWGSGWDSGLEAGALPGNVRVMNRWIGESEVESVLIRFDVLVAPYLEASQSGVIPLAATLGVPSLVTPVGGLTEQVEHGRTGLHAAATSAQSVSQSMGAVLDDPALVRRLGSGAIEHARTDRSIARFGADLAAAMEGLVALGKRRTRWI